LTLNFTSYLSNYLWQQIYGKQNLTACELTATADANKQIPDHHSLISIR